jgi:bifunctional DNase/RNase
MVAVRVSHVVQLDDGQGWLVGLYDEAAERVLPIRVGDGEGLSIAAAAQGQGLRRPLTHDLLLDVIQRLGGSIQRAVVHDLREGTFIGSLEIRTAAGVLEVDCRPSDAIALAVRVHCPIEADEEVLDRAAIPVRPGEHGPID